MGKFQKSLQGVWSCEVSGEDAISFTSADDWKIGLTGGNANTVTIDGNVWESVTIPADPTEPPTTINGTISIDGAILTMAVEAMDTPYEDPAEFVGRSWSVGGVPETVETMAQLDGDHDPVRWTPLVNGFALEEDEDSALICTTVSS